MDHYLAHATIANVTKRFFGQQQQQLYYQKDLHTMLQDLQDRITRKTCKWLVCQYAHCPRWGLAQTAKPQGKSLVVVPRSVDNGGMIEIHIRNHRRHSSEIVKPRPITKARQMWVQTKSRFFFFSNARLGLRSPIVERNKQTYLSPLFHLV